MKTAGAPIAWGVSAMPGWGYQLDRARVLAEMRDLGFAATELGPPGYLPPSPARRAALLAEYGLRGLGGFTPLVLHDPAFDPVPDVRATLRGYRDGDVEIAIFAAVANGPDYDLRPQLDSTGWKTLLTNLGKIVEEGERFGRTAVLHPHAGTAIANADEVTRLLDESDIPLCLDTGHLLLGGTDPAALVRAAPERIAHVHLKDVDAELAAQLRAGNLTYTEAVRAGLFRPLGEGELDTAAVVAALSGTGYDGWYVVAPDTALTREPPPGEGPMTAVRASLDHLAGLT
ncbi:inosose dehydratase [Spongiactinospora rosea]|uniref:Inosose dehydratase n=1 Tax=Spongiactinospora rosea TaxID=2248750 RepID=A0A366LZM1_9ACTN|nr:TIM barrel protein [Spongiactinospora rosea]RBQ18622.1 inosose dehydratase [Spongiactinospora rosea]